MLSLAMGLLLLVTSGCTVLRSKQNQQQQMQKQQMRQANCNQNCQITPNTNCSQLTPLATDCQVQNNNCTQPLQANNECCQPQQPNCCQPQQNCTPKKPAVCPPGAPVLKKENPLKLSVVGQGVAPCNGTCSPAQAFAMAKRAAIADAYRLIAEKVKGVYVEGEDTIRNMAVKRSTIRTAVSATVRNANVIETTFKDGLCEVEMEIKLSYADIVR